MGFIWKWPNDQEEIREASKKLRASVSGPCRSSSQRLGKVLVVFACCLEEIFCSSKFNYYCLNRLSIFLITCIQSKGMLTHRQTALHARCKPMCHTVTVHVDPADAHKKFPGGLWDMQIYTHLLHGKLVCVDMPSGTLGPILSSLCTLASIQVDGCFGSTREVVPGLLWCNLAGEFCILSDRNRLCASAALHLECV